LPLFGWFTIHRDYSLRFFFFRSIIFLTFFFFTRIIFLGFRIFKVILTIILILRPTDPENNLVVSWPRKFFFAGYFFQIITWNSQPVFWNFFYIFFSALFETDIYTRAMIFNSYYGRCFLKGFFFANFLFHRRIWILKSAEDDVFFEGGKVEKRPNGFSLFCM